MGSERAMCTGKPPVHDPRSVSRGSKLQLGFLGIDSLYLVVEYPYRNVYHRWHRAVDDLLDVRLHDGIPFEGMVVRRGLLGYRLSVWDGDARLLVTDQVEEALRDTPRSGQGMGLMLQLGPIWLRRYGDSGIRHLKQNIYGQLLVFGLEGAEEYPIRLNRLDLTVDVLGLPLPSFSIDEWQRHWVGYANRKDFHISAQTGELEGLSIGSSSGAIRFKVYDKNRESCKRGLSRFWRSVWGVGEVLT